MPSETSLTLSDLLCLLARGMLDQQQLLDENFRRALDGFLPLLEEARAGGYEQAALAVLPSPLVLSEVEIETSFRVAAKREGHVELDVQLLNLGFSRRYSRSSYAESRLRLSVHRLPLGDPGPKPGIP